VIRRSGIPRRRCSGRAFGDTAPLSSCAAVLVVVLVPRGVGGDLTLDPNRDRRFESCRWRLVGGVVEVEEQAQSSASSGVPTASPLGRKAGSTHATDVMTQELHGQDIAISEAAEPVAVVCRLGDLKAATPVPAEMTADLDRRTDRKVGSRCVTCWMFHGSLVETLLPTEGIAYLDRGSDGEVRSR
jgi:hypothetical protein